MYFWCVLQCTSDCLYPIGLQHSTCPVCRRKLPHEEDSPPQQPVAEPEAAAVNEPAWVNHHRTRSSTRMAAQDTQHPTGAIIHIRSGSLLRSCPNVTVLDLLYIWTYLLC